MTRYIDEELLIEKMTRLRGCSCSYSDGIIDEIEDIMSDISTEDVIEKANVDKAIEEITNLSRYQDGIDTMNVGDDLMISWCKTLDILKEI